MAPMDQAAKVELGGASRNHPNPNPSHSEIG
jgi:hypothetical protein